MDAHAKALSIGGRLFKSSSVNVIFKGKKVDEHVVKVKALVVGSDTNLRAVIEDASLHSASARSSTSTWPPSPSRQRPP